MKLQSLSLDLLLLLLTVYIFHYFYILINFKEITKKNVITGLRINHYVKNIKYNCGRYDHISTLNATDLLWSFWYDEEVMPIMIMEIILSWKIWNPSMHIIVINANNIDCFLHEEDSFLYIQSLPLRSDLIRLSLLQRYGGTWLDATVLLTKSLPSWDGLSFLASHTEHYCKSHQDFIESWYLRAPKNSYIIKTWKTLLMQVLAKNDYLVQGISSTFIYNNKTLHAYPLIVGNINGIEKKWSEYLVLYVAFTYLYYNDDRFNKLILSSQFVPSESMGYFVQWQEKWNEKKLYEFLKSSSRKNTLYLTAMKS